MRIYQQELPFNVQGDAKSRIAKIDWKGSIGNWWYIEHGNSANKCLYADEKGNYYFGLKEFAFVVPVVWNNRKEASRVARAQKGKVKKFPYLLKAF